MAEDLERQAARMFTVGFDGKTLSSDLKGLLDRGVGGVVFFARNVGTPEEVFELTRAIKRHAGRPVLIAVDQEGGRVARLRQGFTPIPSMRAVGAAGDRELCRALGRVLGRELRAVGFDLNFAPILDVDTNPDNPIIATRSFGRSAALVSSMGTALLEGIQSAGVGACGKHFPGHGDTNQDSHRELPRLSHDLGRLNDVELPPFRAAVEAGIAAIMTAHVIFEPVDAAYPATMSRPVLDGILRRQMGYDGLVVTDDLEMNAIAEHYGLEEAVVRGVQASVDSFLCCHTPERMHRAIDTVIDGVRRGVLDPERIQEANRRIAAFVTDYVRAPTEQPALEALASPEHRRVAEAILARVDRETAEPGVDPTEIMEELRQKAR